MEKLLSSILAKATSEAEQRIANEKAVQDKGRRYAVSYQAIAKELNRSEETVKDWMRGGPDVVPSVPDSLVLKFCRITGEKPWLLAPHLYPECCDIAIDGYIQWYRGD